uniref:Uncharacterized protein n=1 Tax=Rangifer tarandus platyrhynchus TaxID=3082113 RepID=A0ACB0F3J6_RANTA|nr:unnamed protein product [Rangifer tarandus platyrhynchus]
MNAVIQSCPCGVEPKTSPCRGCIFGCQYIEKKHSYTLADEERKDVACGGTASSHGSPTGAREVAQDRFPAAVGNRLAAREEPGEALECGRGGPTLTCMGVVTGGKEGGTGHLCVRREQSLFRKGQDGSCTQQNQPERRPLENGWWTVFLWTVGQ